MKIHIILLLIIISTSAFSKTTILFDHKHLLWEAFIQGHVHEKEGISWVNYKKAKENPDLLKNYLYSLGGINQSEFNNFNKNQKIAFLTNLYNAQIIKLVIDNYPIRTIKDLSGMFSDIFKKEFFNFLGEKTSLLQLEKKLIAIDKKAIFLLNKSAISSPRLTSIMELSAAKKTEENFVLYSLNRTHNRFNSQIQRFEVSKLFMEYGLAKSEIAEKLTPILFKDRTVPKSVQSKQFIVHFNSFYWDLNDFAQAKQGK